MDYQELEAFKKLSTEARELKMVQDLSDVKTGVEQLTKLLGSEGCPFSNCSLKQAVGELKTDVENLKTTSNNQAQAKLSTQSWVGIISVAVLAVLDLIFQVFGKK